MQMLHSGCLTAFWGVNGLQFMYFNLSWTDILIDACLVSLLI